MRVRIDLQKCSGDKTCNLVCSEVFKLDDWGYAYVTDEEVSESFHEKVHEAQAKCPERAILINNKLLAD